MARLLNRKKKRETARSLKINSKKIIVASHVIKKIHHSKWNWYPFYEIKSVMGLQVLSEKVESSWNQTTPLQISRDPFLNSPEYTF